MNIKYLDQHPGYAVSDTGAVISMPRRNVTTGRVLKPRLDKRGYSRVNLCRDGKQSTHRIHTLVAEAFLGPRPDGYDVCHGNGDPSDNRLSNLRYATRTENMRDRAEHGRYRSWNSAKTHCIRGHAFDADNTYKAPDGKRSCRACNRARQAKRAL